EDGIRDRNVTGVQTSALLISAALTQLLCALAPARLNGDLMRATAASRGGRLSWCVAIRRPWPAGLDASWFLNDGGERRWRLLVGCVVAGREIGRASCREGG